jgi:O-antigen/teichoic acid export membrane protein
MKLPTLPTPLRGTLFYLVTIVLTQVSSFVLLPIITRYLVPSAYGEYALALAVATLMGMIGSSWIRNVGFRFYFDAKAAGTTRAFYASLAALQAVVFASVFTVGALVLPHVSDALVPIPTLLAAGAMILVSDFQALTVALLRAEQLSGRFAVAEISAASMRLAGTSAGLMMGFTDPAFLFLAAGGASLLGGAMALRSLTTRLTGRAAIDPRAMWRVLVRAPGALPFSVGQWLGRLADRLVLNAYATTAVVGIYAAGYGLSDRIVGGLEAAVFMMAWPDVLRSYSDGGVELARHAIRRYYQLFLWITVGPLVALMLYGDSILRILGAGYQDALPVLAPIAFAAWLKGVNGGLNRHFELEKRYYALSLMTLGGAGLHLALNFVLIPRYMAVGAGMAALGAQLVLTVAYFLVRDRRLVWFPWRDGMLVVMVTIALALPASTVLGGGVEGLLTFAGGYAVVTAAMWVRRIRAGWRG